TSRDFKIARWIVEHERASVRCFRNHNADKWRRACGHRRRVVSLSNSGVELTGWQSTTRTFVSHQCIEDAELPAWIELAVVIEVDKNSQAVGRRTVLDKFVLRAALRKKRQRCNGDRDILIIQHDSAQLSPGH